MKIIKAKILDATHLELSQPVLDNPGDDIVIAVPDIGIISRGGLRTRIRSTMMTHDDEIQLKSSWETLYSL